MNCAAKENSAHVRFVHTHTDAYTAHEYEMVFFVFFCFIRFQHIHFDAAIQPEIVAIQKEKKKKLISNRTNGCVLHSSYFLMCTSTSMTGTSTHAHTHTHS